MISCDYFMGVINGLLGIFSVKATTREIECQWNGAQACCYEDRAELLRAQLVFQSDMPPVPTNWLNRL
jgi:hypothetical protein